MAKPKVDAVIGDCPECNAVGQVKYRGTSIEDPSQDEGVCVKCGEIFEVDFDDDEQEAPPPPPPPPPPAPAPPPPPVAVVADLKPIVAASTGPQPELSEEGVTDFGNDFGIPAYIKAARPWKFAHKMNKVGNPYRESTNNYVIFGVYEGNPCTVEQCVVECARIGLGVKLSFLLTIYEVTSHCLSAGLLVRDEQSRSIGPCQGKPQPVKVT